MAVVVHELSLESIPAPVGKHVSPRVASAVIYLAAAAPWLLTASVLFLFITALAGIRITIGGMVITFDWGMGAWIHGVKLDWGIGFMIPALALMVVRSALRRWYFRTLIWCANFMLAASCGMYLHFLS